MTQSQNNVILQTKDLVKRFGGLTAVDHVNFTIREGEYVGLIGPNGAGKTTFFNVITGFLKPEAGQVFFEGKDITFLPPHNVTREGIARTFQIPRPLSKLTIYENVLTAGFLRYRDYGKLLRRADEVVDLVELDYKRDQKARTLNPVERKKLALGRALMTNPKLLLIDEIVAGLNPREIEDILDLLRAVHQEVSSIIMVEHVMRAVMQISERIFVLDFGKKIAEGTPEEIAHNEEVIKAYLGSKGGKTYGAT